MVLICFIVDGMVKRREINIFSGRRGRLNLELFTINLIAIIILFDTMMNENTYPLMCVHA